MARGLGSSKQVPASSGLFFFLLLQTYSREASLQLSSAFFPKGLLPPPISPSLHPGLASGAELPIKSSS